MPAAAPGNAELMRAVEGIRTDIRDLRMDLAKDYVRKEVQDERERVTDLQINGLEVEVTDLNSKIDRIGTQRDAERDARDTQHSSDRRWLKTMFITALGGPILTVVILHAMHLLGASPR